ncbi:endonuclease [Mycolicibacterium duvalii]|nr:endonuclease/exonuclease/phosphatase family protein [Mycolicibacterium duvalii]PEG39925.1 endonuclease [Mycolicibacterium duvalii]
MAVSAPYAVLAALSVLVVAVLRHRVVLSLVAVVVVAISAGVQLNWYYGRQGSSLTEGVNIRVLSVNLRKGRADVPSVVELARHGADVLALSELTPSWVRQFYASGTRDVFPYSLLVPAPDAGGIGIWSRYPLDSITPLNGGSMVAARAAVPGLPEGVLVAAVHVMNPLTFYGKAFDEWRSGITAVNERMRNLAEKAGAAPVVLAGDFNSTPDMRQFRDLLGDGYRNATSQTGSGWSPTFPSARRIPPLVTIDHILARNAYARSIRAVEMPRTDHRALLATIVVPLT